MIDIKPYLPPEVIPQKDLEDWRRSLRRTEDKFCPDEVRQFITAVAAKLPDFGQIGKERDTITGYELQLSGVKEMRGETINAWELYELPVPRMVAVDHHAAMHRIYNRKGKQGLIDYCRARIKGTELERILTILNVHVFNQERPEFMKVLHDINASPKATTPINV